MGPGYFVIAILGCADGGSACTQVATLPTRYSNAGPVRGGDGRGARSEQQLRFPDLARALPRRTLRRPPKPTMIGHQCWSQAAVTPRADSVGTARRSAGFSNEEPVMGQNSHAAESPNTQNQNNAMSDDPRDGHRLTDNPKATAGPPPRNRHRAMLRNSQVEEFAERGMGAGAKE